MYQWIGMNLVFYSIYIIHEMGPSLVLEFSILLGPKTWLESDQLGYIWVSKLWCLKASTENWLRSKIGQGQSAGALCFFFFFPFLDDCSTDLSVVWRPFGLFGQSNSFDSEWDVNGSLVTKLHQPSPKGPGSGLCFWTLFLLTQDQIPAQAEREKPVYIGEKIARQHTRWKYQLWFET